jgi:hypothetical protein
MSQRNNNVFIEFSCRNSRETKYLVMAAVETLGKPLDAISRGQPGAATS